MILDVASMSQLWYDGWTWCMHTLPLFPGTCLSACSRVFLLVSSRRDRFHECDTWCGACCPGTPDWSPTTGWNTCADLSWCSEVIVKLLTNSVEHPITLPNQRSMSVCESEMSELNECVCRCTGRAHQGLFNNTDDHLCSITFRLQICLTNLNDRTWLVMGHCTSTAHGKDDGDNWDVCCHQVLADDASHRHQVLAGWQCKNFPWWATVGGLSDCWRSVHSRSGFFGACSQIQVSVLWPPVIEFSRVLFCSRVSHLWTLLFVSIWVIATMSLSRSLENTLVKPSHGLQQYVTRTPFGHTALQIAQLEPPLTERSDSRKALTTSRKRHHWWRSTADPVSSGDTMTRAVVPEWNEEARTLDSFENKGQAARLGTKKENRHLCGPRVPAQTDPQKQPGKVIRSEITTVQLTREGGANLIVSTLQPTLGMKPIQETVPLFQQMMGLRSPRRKLGEHADVDILFSRFFTRWTGKALHQADANIDVVTFLHPVILGIMLLECSQLTPADNASVPATCASTTKESSTIGNSHLFGDLLESFRPQWDDEAIQRRSKSRHRGARHLAAAASSWAPQLVSPAFSEEEKMSPKRMSGMLILNEGHDEVEEADANHGDDDEWDESSPQDDGELEEQCGSLETAQAFATTEMENASSEMKSAARTFTDAKKLVSQVKSERGFLPGAFDGLQSVSACAKAPRKGEGASPSKSRGHRNDKRQTDTRRHSPAKSPCTWTSIATPIWTAVDLWRGQMEQFAWDVSTSRISWRKSNRVPKRTFGSDVGIVHDRSTTLITQTWDTSLRRWMWMVRAHRFGCPCAWWCFLSCHKSSSQCKSPVSHLNAARPNRRLLN